MTSYLRWKSMIRFSSDRLTPFVPLSRKSFATMGVFLMLYIVVAALCLIQRGGPNPWRGPGVLPVIYLALAAVLGLEQMAFASRLPGSEAVLGEAFGATYDPQMTLCTSLLAIAEFAAFIDYGQLHLVPQLQKAPVQIAGLFLCLATIIWLRWVDANLARHFAAGLESRSLIVRGPYRYLRHPKYAGLIASRIGFALAIPSVLAWPSVFAWFLAVRRRIKLEEQQLNGIFGDTYSAYSARTYRLIPWLY
jgi:protein-S-isoprenylcysteine O-methyltransferase Ste14